MDDLKYNILDFIDTSIDELADADVSGFKQLKAIFKVSRAGKQLIDSSHDTAFENFKDILKHELKELAKSPRTDSEHFKRLLEQFKVLLKDYDQLLYLYKSTEHLEAKLREGTNIPLESELPKKFALLIRNNIEKLIPLEKWDREIFEKLEDMSAESQEQIRTFEESITNQIAYSGSFQEYLDNTELPISRSNYENRLLYLNDTIPLCGREKEISNLHSFLFSKERVAVWAICGQGGVGKSKLARHICQKYDHDFKFVWLKDVDFSKIAEITSGYLYDKPLVFVCDYADERERNIVTLIESIFDSKIKNARFLLLSRDEKWYLRFAKNNSVITEIGFKQTSKHEPLNLSIYNLSNEAYSQILTKYQKAFYPNHQSLSDGDINFILTRAKKATPTNSVSMRANRCLFVLLVADSFLQGHLTEESDSDQLLIHFFERSMEHLAYSDSIKVPGFRLLALATALRGIDIYDDTLPDFIKQDINTINSELNNCAKSIEDFWNKLSENFFEKNILHPYEPDLIGEYLFLWQFFDYLMEPDRRKWCEYLIEKVQTEENENPVEIFINRCIADWPEYGVEKKNFFACYSQVMQEMNESETIHV